MVKKLATVNGWWRAALIATFLLPAGSCGKTSFSSATGVKNAAEAQLNPSGDTSSTTDSGTKATTAVTSGNVAGGSSNTPTTLTTPQKPPIAIDPIKDSEFTMMTGNDMQAALRESRFWVVTGYGSATSYVYYFVMRDKTLIPEAGKAQGTWTFPTLAGQTGMRTYVTEGGLVFASTGGALLWIDPLKTPQGALTLDSPNYYKFPATSTVPNYVAPVAGQRLCVVSYRRGTGRFLGVGYGAGNFVEMKMDATPPYAPQFAISKAVKGSLSGLWGYTCYIDQNRLIYYARHTATGALDLNSMTPIDPTFAPANSDVSALAAQYQGAVNGASYAFFGDRKGNLFGRSTSSTTANYYTFTHDFVSDNIFAFRYGSKIMEVYPHDCLTTKTDCVFGTASGGLSFNYSTKTSVSGDALGTIGPVSAVKVGGFIGLTRWSPRGQVLYITPTDIHDISKGVDITKLADVSGDPYMYTDFTGATLYNITEKTVSFAFSDIGTFDATRNVRYVAFNWSAVAGTPTTWSHLSLEARCYSGTDGSAVAYATVDTVKDANLNTYLSIASCRDAKVDHIDLKITQLDNASTASGMNTVNVGFFQ